MKTVKMINIFAALLLSITFGCQQQNPQNEATITLNRNEISVNLAQTFTLAATVNPPSDLPVIWTSDNESVATVDNGTVTGISAGVCEITAACGDLSAKCEVTVLPEDLQILTIELNKVILNILVGGTETLIPTVTPESELPIVWTSSNENIATAANGIVTGVSVGSCIITAACGDVSAACTVNVFDAENPEIPQTIDGYTLVWSDEFSGASLNSNVWTIEVNGDGGGNNELQYYTARPQNVSVGIDSESGASCLILTAMKENYSGKTCTSGRVITRNNVTYTHGLIEARIKIPYTANGLWPAFWQMGNDIGQVGWPKCGEIDIMEMGNNNGINAGTQDRYFNGAAHWGQSWENHPNYANAITNSYSVQGSYHTFRLYWTNDYLTMYLDKDIYPNAQPYYQMGITPSDNTNSTGYYFHKPNFILFNLAIGGQFPNIYNINNVTALNADNNYTASMYIDYVRVYQKGENGETFYQR